MRKLKKEEDAKIKKKRQITEKKKFSLLASHGGYARDAKRNFILHGGDALREDFLTR